MAINDEWEYERTLAGLAYQVVSVGILRTGWTPAWVIAAFPTLTDATHYAEESDKFNRSGPGIGYAVVGTEDDFVHWTSF